MATEATENQEKHTRANKLTTYLASAGTLSTGLWILGMSLAHPIIGVAVGAGIVAMSVTEKGRDIAQKIGSQFSSLFSDLKSHISEDFSRLTNWYDKRRDKITEVRAASIERASSAFKNISSKAGFNKSADPAPVVDDKPQSPKPVAKSGAKPRFNHPER